MWDMVWVGGAVEGVKFFPVLNPTFFPPSTMVSVNLSRLTDYRSHCFDSIPS